MKKRTRFLFLMLLSLLSVFFSEVISGSMMFPLFDIWGYVVVVPLYGFHIIIILYVINKYVVHKRIRFSTLYFAGVLFGLYEAYITKVLWVGLAEDSFHLFHVAIIDYLVLVFFWHPLLSIIIPVLVFERLVSKTDYVYQGLPVVVKQLLQQKYGLLLIMIIVGFYSAFNGILSTLPLSELSLLIPILILLVVIYKKELDKKYTLDEILPTAKGMIFFYAYVVLIYLSLGIFFKRDVLTLPNQLPIWLSYVLFGFLFYKKLMSNKELEESVANSKVVSLKAILFYAVSILLSGVGFVLIIHTLGIRDIVVVVTWITWIFTGIMLLIYSILH